MGVSAESDCSRSAAAPGDLRESLCLFRLMPVVHVQSFNVSRSALIIWRLGKAYLQTLCKMHGPGFKNSSRSFVLLSTLRMNNHRPTALFRG